MKKILALLLLSCVTALADPTNWILNSSNTSISITNFRGRTVTDNLSGLPLGSIGSSATGELGLKVIVLNAGGGGLGDATAANQTSEQANPGSDASKAVAVQGVTGGKAVPVSFGVQRTPTINAHTTSGSVALGCRSLVFIASNDFVGTVLTNFTPPAGSGLTIPIPTGDTLGAVAYTVTAGTLYSVEVR